MKLPALTPARLDELLALIANRPCLQRKDLARRYGRDVRTIDRWHADGTLPRAKHFHGPLWTPAEIEAAENSLKLKRELARTAPPATADDKQQVKFKF